MAIAVPAVLAVVAGVATVAGALHLNPGGWLTAFLAAVAAAQPAARSMRRWGLGQRLAQQRAEADEQQRQRELDEILAHPARPVREVTAKDVGVAPSWPRQDAYVRRDVDAELRERLRTQDFVLVTGESGAGKSRTALEAARAACPEWTLLVPAREPVQSNTLSRAIELFAALQGGPEQHVLLWLDDLENFLDAEALTDVLLNRWRGRRPPVTVLATMQEQRWASRRWPATAPGATEQAEGQPAGISLQAAALLLAGEPVKLPRLLTGAERPQAAELYGDWDWERLGLGEILGRGPELLEKLSAGETWRPHGVAIVRAAIDWRRTGAGRAISRTELQGLSEQYLPDLLDRREDFAAGLRWACEALSGSDIRLLRPRYGRTADDEFYEPHDYVMADSERRAEPVPQRTWEWILACESLTPGEAVLVGDAAYTAGRYGAAERAYARAEQSADGATAAKSLNSRAVAVWQFGRHEEAMALWRDVERRYGESAEPAVRISVALALRNQGISLRDLSRSDEALATLESVVQRFGDDAAPEVLRQVALALRNAAGVYRQGDRFDDAIRACDELVRRFADSADPSLRHQAAQALLDKGFWLHELGRYEDQVAAYEEAERRYGQPGEPAHQELAHALRSKGLALQQLGRDDEAVAAFEAVEEAFGRDDDRDVQRQVAYAIDNRANLLLRLGRLDEEVAARGALIARFAGTPDEAVAECVESARLHQRATLGELDPLRILAATPPVDASRLRVAPSGRGRLITLLLGALPFLAPAPPVPPSVRLEDLDPNSELYGKLETLRTLCFCALFDVCSWLAGARQPVPDQTVEYGLSHLRAVEDPRGRLSEYVEPHLLASWDEALAPFFAARIRMAPELGDSAELREEGLDAGGPVRVELRFSNLSSLVTTDARRPLPRGEWALTLWITADLTRVDDAMLRPVAS